MSTSVLLTLSLLACSSDKSEDEATTETSSTSDTTTDVATDDSTSSDWDGHVFAVNCQALEAHFVTAATSSVNDWTGYWECYQEANNCEGPDCTWSVADLPDYVVNEACDEASTCSIGGETVAECSAIENTGSVTFDCSADDTIVITANGLPDHTFENYAQSGELPPLLGSTASNTEYSISNAPVYRSDSELFEMGGGTIAVAVNGVSIFNQFTGIGTVAVEDEIVDDCGGHPANGTYHYHAWPKCGELVSAARVGAEGSHSGLVGLSKDGFPVFGPYGYNDAEDESSSVVRLESCYAFTACDDSTNADCYTFDETAYANGECHLDRCNGRVTAVPANLQAALGEQIYAYYMTMDSDGNAAFPYQPYCYRGDAESGPGGGPPQ